MGAALGAETRVDLGGATPSSMSAAYLYASRRWWTPKLGTGPDPAILYVSCLTD